MKFTECLLLVAAVIAWSQKGLSDMPMLKWAGKDKVVNHHNEVPFRVLERKWEFPEGSRSCATETERTRGSASLPKENMVIHGDNLAALKSLLPRYEGRVKCIYIDPPYNTGNEGWVYNDNVNDPQIKKWLGEVVGKEGEDFSRHDKWLCMMYPRLRLLQKLLSNDGAIFISIDDNELYNLKLVCDEIFGSNSFIANISWQRTYSMRNDVKGVAAEVEHILAYSKQPGWQPHKLERTEGMDSKYKNPDNDPRGSWRNIVASAPDSALHQGMVYAIQNPITGEYCYPPKGRHWSLGQDQMLSAMNKWCAYKLVDLHDKVKRAELCGVDESSVREDVLGIVLDVPLEEARRIAERMYREGVLPEFYFSKKGVGALSRKAYIKAVGGRPVTNFWPHDEVGHTDEASRQLKVMFGGNVVFDTPKPVRLIERILKIATDKDSIVLDSFAGSGTTAHAVLNMNKEDGGNRRFILVEMMDYAETVTAERVKRVISGYGQGDKAVAGTGGGFGYYELGEPLMNGDVLNENLPIEKIREYVWFMETRGSVLATKDTKNTKRENELCDLCDLCGKENDPYLLGVVDETAYYFCYEKAKKVTLNRALLRRLKTKAERYVIYADICLVEAAELKKMNIVFKKIPRDITRL